MPPPKEFKLERFFAKWEFAAKHLLCCSDVQPLAMSELLGLCKDDPDLMDAWEHLSLGYTEQPGLPAFRKEVASMCVKRMMLLLLLLLLLRLLLRLLLLLRTTH